jgi:1-acyl-sn-glycerol-3-phosphate acyltransferase
MTQQRWQGRADLTYPPPGWRGWMGIAWRVPVLLVVNFLSLVLLLILRLVERPLCGMSRPVTPRLTVAVCRLSLRVIGIRRQVKGRPMVHHGAGVSNHATWLDIYALNAGHPLYFVAKSEVAGWPGIGWLARATGTVFIRRARTEAMAHVAQFQSRLAAGHRLMFFPEGTSSDGLRVLPFRTTLFAAFLEAPEALWLQPVTLIWTAPPGKDPAFFGWWGGMGFGASLRAMLAHGRGGRVTVVYHAPVPAIGDRKDLARRLEHAVRAGLDGQTMA